jgi:hypothetical protein
MDGDTAEVGDSRIRRTRGKRFAICNGERHIHAESSGHMVHQSVTDRYQPEFHRPTTQYRERNSKSEIEQYGVGKRKSAGVGAGRIRHQDSGAKPLHQSIVSSDQDQLRNWEGKAQSLPRLQPLSQQSTGHAETHLEDLYTISGLELKNRFSCVYDPENQFFPVKLAPEARKYFGFSIQDEGGWSCSKYSTSWSTR